MKGIRVMGAGALLAVLLGVAPAWAADAPVAAPKARTAWSSGSNWLVVRAGYAKSTVTDAANGMFGYGFGFRHFLLSNVSAGLFLHHDLLGKNGAASEIQVPVALELAKHFGENVTFHPYVALGGGGWYHKYYRTGQDRTLTTSGVYLAFGADAPVANGHLVGLDARYEMVRMNASDSDPDFGLVEGDNVGRWSVKLEYALAY